MSSAPRLGRFELQVRLALVLLVVFLAVLDVVNLALLSRAVTALEGAERGRTVSTARDIVQTMGPATVAALGASPSGARRTDDALRALASRFDCARVAILDPAGREAVASAPVPAPGAFERLEADDRAALAAGRAVALGTNPDQGTTRRVTAFVPVLGAAGGPAAIVEVVRGAPELGRLERSVRLLVAVETGGVALIAILAYVFARWVSRPYRVIVAAAGEAGVTVDGAGTTTGPVELAEAFRQVARKMREQERTLESLGGAGGGLGELVRFAGGPARGMATGVLVVDRRGRIAEANDAAAVLLGGARGEDLKREDLAASRAPGLWDLVRSCLDERRGASREVVAVRRDDGATVHLGVTVSPASGYGAESSGALVLMTDLTEIRSLQEQARVRENLAAVGAVAAGMAHEFRNALAAILGWARMIEKRDDPRVRGPAREIVREVESSREAIDEFLAYARPPEPQRVTVDLEALVRACAAAGPVEIGVEVAGEFGAVLGDPGLLRRVFGNLLQNAADAALEIGRPLSVRIVGRRAASGRHWLVEVDDDGPGIPADRREQIFTPFVTTRARGTGLGLAFVQRTLVDMGGSVEASDGSRGGACFRLRLPVATPDGSLVPSRNVTVAPASRRSLDGIDAIPKT